MVIVPKKSDCFPAVSFHEGPSFPGGQAGHLIVKSQKIFLKQTDLLVAVKRYYWNYRGPECGKNGAQRNTGCQGGIRNAFSENEIGRIYGDAEGEQQKEQLQNTEQICQPNNESDFSGVIHKELSLRDRVVIFHFTAPSSVQICVSYFSYHT